MLTITRSIRRFCSQASPVPLAETVPNTAANESTSFVGRVGTSTDPRTLAPVITSNVLLAGKEISFTCISRLAAAKAMHAAAIANVKNQSKKKQVFVKFSHLPDLIPKSGLISRGLSSFKISMTQEESPDSYGQSEATDVAPRRTRVSATIDHQELAKNLHLSYMRRVPVTLQCMGDKAMSVVVHSLAVFNEKVASHDLLAYPVFVRGKNPDGSEISTVDIRLIERRKE